MNMKIKDCRIRIVFALAMLLLCSLAASAISGNFSDAGGGEYWCNVYVHATTAGKSYKSLTGEDENAAMQKFRGFESEHDGTLSTQYSTIKMRFRYHYNQGGDFEYEGSEQEFYVMTRDGQLHKIGEFGKDDLESVFGHAKVFNTVKGKEGFAMNSGTAWTSKGLESLEVGKLYKLKVKSNIDHNIVGTMIDTRTATQTIYPGWNWIGPLSIYNLSLEEAFADLNPTRGDMIKSKTQVAFYDGYKWEGDLTAVIPGMGYYYKSEGNKAVTFHYPTIDASYVQAAPPVMRAPEQLPFTPVDHHQFSDNMNVVARIVKDGVDVDDLCLAAFVDGECRGVTTATDDGLYLLTIAGNADEAGKNVYFATVYGGEKVWFVERLQWLSDWIYGDLEQPHLFDIDKTSGIDGVISSSSISITPAVVTDVINVRAGDILQEVNVYNVNGKLLDHFTPDDNQATLNLSHLIDGVYFIEARTLNGSRAIKQILKQ